ncbi:glycosyltransferase family 4 protein [Lepagella muris]|jgi:glycosyltransferase involved in cell wall biosynthesis|uniref:Glycosyltransferase family 1 protein n=1 Tax=Lepagella muris TaxID=3032870 RepID=A0AC61RDV3_9BACT|nr:glycosyltransferase family 4 protein [Lepagella muris]ROT03242.1 glycosyltransferase family 1 protein [Muribaculaceae bacterium Isolate-037 (Harlan)]TGY77147.1 glycosyltransferase family 1 protein [Lepagella muris]THG49051.1 glycosyltransferase family 4 protein [Bacteroidales bacterium]TKC54604.1 glycosyltransferase family 4 protein [Bacteroidales bacterium]
MKIIHLSSNKIWGGVERYILDLAIAQRKSGENVAIFTKGHPLTDSPFIQNGFEVGRLRLNGVLDFISPVKLANYIGRHSEDDVIIHAHNFKNAITAVRTKSLCRNKNVKVVTTLHFRKKAHTSAFWSFIYGRIDKIIFVSEIIKKIFLEPTPKIKMLQTAVVYNSVIVPKKVDADMHVQDGCLPKIVYTGRVCEDKGIEVLINSISLLKDIPFMLHVVGTGDADYMSYLGEMSERYGVADKIVWEGHKRDVYPSIADAYVGVAPSICIEAFGLTIIEFMSQGVPVVASDNGAQPEIITNGEDGMLVSPSSPEQLAAAIRKLLMDEKLRSRMGRNARLTFESKFSYPKFFAEMQAIYQSVISQKSKL